MMDPYSVLAFMSPHPQLATARCIALGSLTGMPWCLLLPTCCLFSLKAMLAEGMWDTCSSAGRFCSTKNSSMAELRQGLGVLWGRLLRMCHAPFTPLWHIRCGTTLAVEGVGRHWTGILLSSLHLKCDHSSSCLQVWSQPRKWRWWYVCGGGICVAVRNSAGGMCNVPSPVLIASIARLAALLLNLSRTGFLEILIKPYHIPCLNGVQHLALWQVWFEQTAAIGRARAQLAAQLRHSRL